ncbi:MAG: zinc-dependent metalloprotease [Bacteroidetes bacterium]|nr:zinc-dependent metalloprotease [Bacteroidota bacterium]
MKKILIVLLLIISCIYSYAQEGYESVISRTQKTDGLFTTYRDKGEFFLEHQKGFDKKLYLLKMTNLTSIDELGFFAGLTIGEMTFKLERRNDNLDIVKINELILPDTNKFTNYNQYVTSRFGPLKIEGFSKDSSKFLTKINSFFTSDVANLQFLFQQLVGGYYSINSELTFIEQVKTFPKNVEITVNYVFNTTSTPVGAIPDSRSINFKVRYSLIDLTPDSAGIYIPRYSDVRVGYFETSVKDYSNPIRKSELVKYVSRWNLQKKNPNDELSEPVKPIVYWIDRATPIEYRDAIKKGVLLWNKAFEKIGFKNALQCNIQPDSVQWDSDDIRYNVLRWQSFSVSGIAGIGPSISNPFTGEILNSSVLINSEALRFTQDERTLFSLLNAKEQLYNSNFDGDKVIQVLEKINKRKFYLCRHSEYSQNQALIGAVKFVIDNNISDVNEIPKEYIYSYLTELVVHEVGHTLGLRHNFKASTAYTFDEIRNPEFTNQWGNGSSVMDYNPANISPAGEKQGTYWSPAIGMYDYFAIEYGYKIFPNVKNSDDEIPYLIAIASKSSDPRLVYGTDEDAINLFGPTSIDPLTQTFDLGNSPLQFAKDKMLIDTNLFRKIEKYFPLYNESYSQLSAVFSSLLFDYFSNTMVVSKYIGGAYLTKMKQGDVAGGRYPVIPVSREEQIDALNFLNTYAFNAEDYLSFSKDFLKMLQPPPGLRLRMDFPLNDIINIIQLNTLYRLYHPLIMKRMLEQENLSSDVLTLNELNDFLFSAIWKEVRGRNSISKNRRALQKSHLDILIEMLVNPPMGMPEDARSLAYKSLNELKRDLAGYRSANDIDSFHVKECEARIDKALNSIIINQR